jgi:excisionase family DNA binding protein
MNDQPTVSIGRACEIVGVSRRTIYNWMNAGLLEIKRTAGGSIRIVEASLWRSTDAPRQIVRQGRDS